MIGCSKKKNKDLGVFEVRKTFINTFLAQILFFESLDSKSFNFGIF